MSMLAEPRRKVRYVLNPKNENWTNDESKFGQKLMEKMGWSKGKGLGLNMDGNIDHIKVRVKNNQQGVGFQERNDQWTAHEDNFASLLKNLQTNTDLNVTKVIEATNQSLEEKSKSLKARVHYKKFTRGKDLSKYSAKDLANIFGRKTLEKPVVTEEPKEEKAPETGVKNELDGLLINKGSVTDYFKNKMAGFKLKFSDESKKEEDDFNERPSFEFGASNGFGLGFQNGDKDDDFETKPSFGLGFKKNAQTDTSDFEGALVINEKKKRKASEALDPPLKPSKKVKTGIANEAFNSIDKEPDDSKANPCDYSMDISNENPYEVKAKKSKKKLKQNGITNPTFDDSMDTNEDVVVNNSELLANGVASLDGEKKKKKKKKCKRVEENEDLGVVNACFNEHEISTLSNELNKSEDVNSYELIVHDRNLEEGGKKKKKKKDKKQELINDSGVVNPCFNEIETTGVKGQEENPYEVVVKEKKKKKCKKNLENGIDNVAFSEAIVEEITQQTEKSNKKKKRQKLGDIMEESVSEVTPEEFDVEKSKKKKKKRNSQEETSEINQSVEDSLNVSETQPEDKVVEVPEEITTEKKKKKKRKNKNQDSENEEKTLDASENVTPQKQVSSSQQISANETPNLDELAKSLEMDGGLIMNVAAAPEPKPILVTPQSTTKRRKSVRIDESLNQERIIPNVLLQKQMQGVVSTEANEFFDINAAVIQRGLELERAEKNVGINNHGFDANATDTSSYSQAMEAAPKEFWQHGVANLAFSNIQEDIQNATKQMDDYQAEVENDINEGRTKLSTIGEPDRVQNTQREGRSTRLAFTPWKTAYVGAKSLMRMHNLNVPKAPYALCVKGDIILEFPDSNLHTINGYAPNQSKRVAQFEYKKRMYKLDQ